MADEQLNQVPLVAGVSNNYTGGAMTALELLGTLRVKCGVSGSTPTTVVGLIGEMARLFDYINEAWLEIQSLHKDWNFLRQPVTFNAQADQATYTAAEMNIASFGRLRNDSFTIYPTGKPEREEDLTFIPYDEFRRRFQFGRGRTETGPPKYFTSTPQGSFVLGPIPNAVYRVHGEAFARPTRFTSNTDRPAMPPEFHMAIVYKAMQFYGLYEAAPEVHGDGVENYNRYIARLAADQLPQIEFGPPLV